MTDRLKGKVALITGAAQGIGKASAQTFVQEGAFVFLCDVNDSIGKTSAHEIGPQARYLKLRKIL